MDESKIDKKKCHCGHAVERQWVFGGIKRGTKICFIVPEAVFCLIKKNIRPECVIIYDFGKVSLNYMLAYVNLYKIKINGTLDEEGVYLYPS